MSIKISSRKQKSRKLQQKIRDRFLKETKDLGLVEGDIESVSMGVSGVDIKLSPAAKKIIPFAIECKAQENLNIWSALKQTENNSEENQIPLLIFKRNNSETYATIKFDDLINIFFKK